MSALLHRVEALSVDHSAAAARGDRAGIGQFFTPAVLAEFMASLLAPRTGEDVRILDPGAGTGILGIAAAERLLSTGAGSVHLVAVEHDADVLPRLRVALEATSAAYGQRFTYDVRVEDFLEYGQLIRPLEVFDVVIANPPYQKAPPDDPRGGGTPNLYTRFMEIAGALLDARGMLCFVIPRSYASGLYFRRFRQRFHRSVSMTRVHVFRSRRDAFKGDRVLQESIIVAAGKSPSETVTISSSEGLDDLSRATALTVPTRRVLDVTSPEAWLHLPETPGDLETLAAVESQPFRLSRLGL
ncbi:MAG: Eco57I restriction-modification methylase domain-containing protein, partial [Dehalococcoidia bacterium]